MEKKKKYTSSYPFSVVLLTEVDKLTKDAQHALRRTMEKYMATCRLILCCNSISKIIAPIQSRCLAIRVPAPSIEDVRWNRSRNKSFKTSCQMSSCCGLLKSFIFTGWPSFSSWWVTCQAHHLKEWSISGSEISQVGEPVGAKLFAECCTLCCFPSRSVTYCPVCVRRKAWLFLRNWLKGLQRSLAGIFGKHCLCASLAEYNSKGLLNINVNYAFRHRNQLLYPCLSRWQFALSSLCRYPFTADQDIPEMDWEVYLRETANAIVSQQTPQR